MIDGELTELCRQARRITKGSMDPLFDDIFDCEAHLKGKQAMFTRAESEKNLVEGVARRLAADAP